MKIKLTHVVLWCLGLSAVTAWAGEREVRDALAKTAPMLQVKKVSESEIKGMYLVETNNPQDIFVSEDGKHLLTGELFSMDSGQLVSISEKRKDGLRKEKIAGIKDADKIIFPAKGETKAKITVFTDIDCGYCRKLHTEVPRMNELGIEVNYLGYPRSGVGRPSFKKYVSAWCADDKRQALTDAKNGKDVPEKDCKNPVAQQFELGQNLGVTGTPAIILQDGTLIPGYVEADKLAKELKLL